MLDTENRCKSSLAFSHLRWTVGVRTVLIKTRLPHSTAAAPSAAEGLPRGGAPSEVLPLVRIGYEPFILHNILPAQDTNSENSSEWSFEEDGKDLPQLPT